MASKFVEVFSTLFGKEKIHYQRQQQRGDEYAIKEWQDPIYVGSTLIKVPIEEDGTVLLSSVQIYFPNSKGLWYIHEDKIRKTKLKYNATTDKIFPPVDGWGLRIYHAVFDANEICSSFEKEIAQERFEIAIKFFHKSVHHLRPVLDVNEHLYEEEVEINNNLFHDCSQYGYLSSEKEMQ